MVQLQEPGSQILQHYCEWILEDLTTSAIVRMRKEHADAAILWQSFDKLELMGKCFLSLLAVDGFSEPKPVLYFASYAGRHFFEKNIKMCLGTEGTYWAAQARLRFLRSFLFCPSTCP